MATRIHGKQNYVLKGLLMLPHEKVEQKAVGNSNIHLQRIKWLIICKKIKIIAIETRERCIFAIKLE
jgi:hypothetical protein